MGIVLILLDEKNSVIHGFIPAARASQYRHVLREGLIFNVGGFEVGRCTNLYKITDHPFVIRFLPATIIAEVSDVGPTIEREKFMLGKLDHLQALAKPNLELPDVVGQIRFVQGSNLTDASSTQRLVVRFRIESSVTVCLSLWDDAAATFRALLSSENKITSVMLVTTVNPKLFGGNLFLNSTPATRFFFDPKIQAIQQFTKSFAIEPQTPFHRAETSEGIQKKERVSIKELYDYISHSNEQIQDADFLCKATIVGVLQRNGWSYVSCAGCNRKLDKYGHALRCNKCVSTNVTGVVRYRVELAVHDGVNDATFVVFDTEMTKLTSKPASTLILEGQGDADNELPSCLENLAGKQFIFQIKLTPFNFTPNHRAFTVSTMTEESTTQDAPQATIVEQNNKLQVEVDNPTTSQPSLTQTATTNMKKDKAASSNGSDVEKNRKRGRE